MSRVTKTTFALCVLFWVVAILLLTAASKGAEPRDITGLQVWLRADDNSGVGDGGAITTWTSRDANAYAFTQATASKKPTYRATGGPKGLPAVELDGGDILVYGDEVSAATAGELFAVVLADVTGAYRGVFCQSDNASTAFPLVFYGQYSTGGWFGLTHGTANSIRNQTAQSASTWYLQRYSSSGTAWSEDLSGTSQSLTVSGSNTGDWFGDHAEANRDHAAIGALKHTGEFFFWDGKIAEIVIYDHQLTAVELRTFEEYIERRYGIDIQNVDAPGIETVFPAFCRQHHYDWAIAL